MKELYQMKGEGQSIRGIARELGLSRNSVRKYLRFEGVPQARPRPRRTSKLDPYTGYIDGRLSDGLDNCVALLRELRGLGYQGGYSILKEYVKPRRRPRQPRATARFETEPGDQAQVGWGSFAYTGEDGRKRRLWAFVMVLGRDEEGRPEWNLRMLDLSFRVGFEMRLCRPYRAQTKGKVESEVKYVRRNPVQARGRLSGPRCGSPVTPT